MPYLLFEVNRLVAVLLMFGATVGWGGHGCCCCYAYLPISGNGSFLNNNNGSCSSTSYSGKDWLKLTVLFQGSDCITVYQCSIV